MRKTTLKLLSIALAACTLLTGCSSSAKTSEENDEFAYLKKLENETYYVRHSDNTCEKVVWTDATFDQNSTVSSANDKRIMWFNEDTYDTIPTLYSGDSLIYKTSDVLTETLVFERFEDFGYSIGLCRLTQTDSNRYSISTDPDKNNTFPNGDTDELLKLNNKTVIIDSLGGTPLRAPEKTANGITVGGPLTRAGSISGLTKDKVYTAEIYEGTTLHKYDFTANVRIMASMEVTKSTDFDFESETIMKINIPSSFNSGYYLINGAGLFRYVKDGSYDDSTNFNIPNETTEDNSSGSTDNNYSDSSSSYNYETSASDDYEPSEIQADLSTSSFTLEQLGITTVRFNITGTTNGIVTGAVTSPSGARFAMSQSGSSFETVFEATETGEYTIEIYNLGDATADVSVSFE